MTREWCCIAYSKAMLYSKPSIALLVVNLCFTLGSAKTSTDLSVVNSEDCVLVSVEGVVASDGNNAVTLGGNNAVTIVNSVETLVNNVDSLVNNADTIGDSVMTPPMNSVVDLTPLPAVVKEDSTVVQQRRMSDVVRKTVRDLDRLNTTYIEPQHYIFTAMMQVTHTYDLYTLKGKGGDRQSITFAPDMNMKLGPYFGWKWFFAGYTFELANLNLKKIKQEFDISIYSNRIGIDLFYRRTGSDYKLRDAFLGKHIDSKPLENLSFDGIKAGITGLNVYYIFNHGRFSYPAAFSQSTIQKISCGSWMAGIGYTKHTLKMDYAQLQQLIDNKLGYNIVQLDSGLMFNNVKYHDFNISGGYGYNWVFKKNWLFASSLQAAIAYKKSTGDVAGTGDGGFSFSNINLDAVGRFGLVYNNMRWYAGASVILHTYNYRKPRFRTNNTFGSLNAYIGYNFGLKKKYRKKKEKMESNK